MQFDPGRLAALESVLRLGGFEAAAAELSITQSAISQRIRALEDSVGAPLVVRSQPAQATRAGARLARHAREIGLLNAALADELGLATSAGRTRIALNADSLETWAIPALARTGLVFDIEILDETVADDGLRDGRLSAAITASDRAVQGCDIHPLGAMRYVATCAPDFRRRHFADGVTAEALGRAPMLDFSGVDPLQRRWLAAQAGRALAPPTHHLPSTTGFVTACLHGLGWGLNPVPLVAAHLAAGRLVTLGDAPETRVPLFWQVRRLMAGALAPLTRAIRTEAATALDPRP